MKRAVIGVDIGGSKIRVGLWHQGALEKNSQVGLPDSLDEFCDLLTAMLTDLGSSQSAVGIGVAGVVSDTKVAICPNISYLNDFDFQTLFKNRSVRVDNDARCAARGHLSYVRETERVLVITIGTGVGRALTQNGRVVTLKEFEYPEKWEPEYQSYGRKSDQDLCLFLAPKIDDLAKKCKAERIIIGGGKGSEIAFYNQLSAGLKKHNLPTGLIKRPDDIGVIGASLLFE